jgi:transposase
MITAGAEKRVLVATKPVDFRKQADGLAAIVQAALGADPFCGTVYVFRPKRTDRVKLLWWDGTGICLMTKRLESGQFRWPPIEDGLMKLSAAQLSVLLDGLEWGASSPAMSLVRARFYDHATQRLRLVIDAAHAGRISDVMARSRQKRHEP